MAATQRNENTGNNAAVLYMAIEMSARTWKLGFGIGGSSACRERNVPSGNLERLSKEIGLAREKFKLEADCPVRSCYEAGRDGFWLHRWLLMQAGVDNLMVDSASIRVDRRARQSKTDRLDVRRLLVQLYDHWRGEARVWSVLRVPEEDCEQSRLLVRERHRLVGERTRECLRISSALIRYGIRVDNVQALKADGLAKLSGPDHKELDARQCREIERGLERLALLGKQIKAIEDEQLQVLFTAPEGSMLNRIYKSLAIKGIGLQGAWTVVSEVLWRKFDNRRQVAGLVGLCGTPYNSGESVRDQGISKAGSGRARAVLVELAWLWLRHQPDSPDARWYAERYSAGSKRSRRAGIVALARRLLITWWRFLCGAQLDPAVKQKPLPVPKVKEQDKQQAGVKAPEALPALAMAA